MSLSLLKAPTLIMCNKHFLSANIMSTAISDYPINANVLRMFTRKYLRKGLFLRGSGKFILLLEFKWSFMFNLHVNKSCN